MLDELKNMIIEAKKAKEIIERSDGVIRIVSHYDADGISSAAIMVKVLTKLKKDFHLSIVKQLSTKLIEELANEEWDVILFLDLGSGQLETIERAMEGRDVIICDHHELKGNAKNIVHINPLLFGINGNISASGVTYILARTILPSDIELSELAIIGAIGDSQLDSIGNEWGLFGLNREILKEGEKSGKIKVSKGLRIWGRYSRPLHKALAYSIDPYIPGITGSESNAVQFLKDIGIEPKDKNGEWRSIKDLSEEEQKKLATEIIVERIRNRHEKPEHIFGDIYELVDREDEFRDANEFATILNACGKMGAPHLAIAICLGNSAVIKEVREIVDKYRKEIGKALDWLHEQIENNKNIRIGEAVYIFGGDAISEHIISNVISSINHSNIFPPEKPLFGFAKADEGVKISARINKSNINLKEIVERAAMECGGEGGGHERAAGATIPDGTEETFISVVENILKSLKNKKDNENINQLGNRKESKVVRSGEKRTKEAGKREKMERKGLVRYFGPK